MGKKTTPGVKPSPDLVRATKSSNETNSHPRNDIPADESERIAPQNFSRGADNVTSTSAPATKGPEDVSEDVISDIRKRFGCVLRIIS